MYISILSNIDQKCALLVQQLYLEKVKTATQISNSFQVSSLVSHFCQVNRPLFPIIAP